MKIVIRSFIPAALAFVAATILFCLPGKEFPEEDWFSKIFLDKWIHIGLFLTLVLLTSLPFIPMKNDRVLVKKTFIRIGFAFVAYGIAIEFVQGSFIPNRTFGVDDMIADSIGCGIGVLLANWQLKNQLK